MRPHPILGVVVAVSCLLWAVILWGLGCFRSSAPTLAAAPAHPVAVPAQEIVQPVDARALTFLVDIPTGWGTAVPVKNYPGHTAFLTAKHVTENAPPHQIKVVVGGVNVPVLFVAQCPDLDVALMLVPVEVPVVEFDTKPVQFGERLYASGWSLGNQHLTEGLASAVDRCSADVHPGMSGGGVFRERRLVGTIEAVYGISHSFGINFPISFMQRFVPISASISWIRATLP